MEKDSLVLDVHEKPNPVVWFFLSFQHVFAMFGATILVPILTGFPVSVALFASGVGTIIYAIITRFKVPVYLGSSFAFISAVQLAVASYHKKPDAALTGLMMVGVIYVIVGLIIKVAGKGWIDKLLPPVVIGPMIAVIGLGLAPVAVQSAGLVKGGDYRNIIVALITFLFSAFISSVGKGFFKIIPFLIAIVFGYIVAVLFGIVDFSPLQNAKFFSIPEFYLPFSTGGVFKEYSLYFGPEMWAMLPVSIITISEHIGDHSVLSKICGRNFLKEPGLDKTLMGDGIATSFSALIGGPANTTYGENTGVIGMTKIASIYVIMGAAVIAILVSTLGYITAAIATIPSAVLGGMSILLYGVISSNGLRVLIDNQVDFGKQKNLIIASAMLVIGLGGAMVSFSFGNTALTLTGTALAAVVGVILNLIIPESKSDDKEGLNTL